MSYHENVPGLPQVPVNEGLREAEARADEFLAVFNVNEILVALDALDREISEAVLSSRFRSDRTLNPLGIGGPQDAGAVPVHGYWERSEVDAKKNSLRMQVQKTRTEVLSLQTRVKGLILDFEASKRDF